MTSRTTPGLGAASVPGRPAAGSGGQDRLGRPHLGLALAVIATAQLMVVLDATIVPASITDHALAAGFSHAFEVAALIALIITITVIQVNREDLAATTAITS